MTGVMCGLACGETLMSKVPLAYPTTRVKALARALLGLSGLMSIFLGLGVVEKKLLKGHGPIDGEIPPFSMQGVRFARYGSVPVFILVIAPMIFNKLKI